jgi:hypothetical protein
MPEKILYEYSVIRLLPLVEREEFINVGIVLFSKSAKYINVIYSVDALKLKAFKTELSIEQVESNLQSFKGIAQGDKQYGPIALYDLPSRFRWLTAVRSSCIQTSRPHPGMAADLDFTIKRLFEEMVL